MFQGSVRLIRGRACWGRWGVVLAEVELLGERSPAGVAPGGIQLLFTVRWEVGEAGVNT